MVKLAVQASIDSLSFWIRSRADSLNVWIAMSLSIKDKTPVHASYS